MNGTQDMDEVRGEDGFPGDEWMLRLYVAGQTLRSLKAVVNMHRLCAEQLDARYRLEVIDLYQQPQLAQEGQIIAVPALVKRLPPPPRMVVGDMSDADHVIVALELQCREEK
jgi:circadian clock protein KaiB